VPLGQLDGAAGQQLRELVGLSGATPILFFAMLSPTRSFTEELRRSEPHPAEIPRRCPPILLLRTRNGIARMPVDDLALVVHCAV